MRLEVKKIGNSTGLILPKELLQDLNLAQGDWVFVTKQADGSLVLARRDEQYEKVMDIARDVMREYHDTFEALAK